ncbi:carbon-nitrogen hydrolase family protein [Rhizosaccharibacter radicis]|uniref:Carbon-nitrogen hydrolase family protein n=1 Tax=Rhizosaccharibacter radicis TaxID=2782605 RepID=A0ABT1VSC0_9PROT|nr:carbon-nitrogen hydrolase family protein [Acetobacteraceae bacterium KSS12]
MRVSVIQMSPGSRKSDNLDQAERLIGQAVEADRPDLVILPEMWSCLGGTADDKNLAAEFIPVEDIEGQAAHEFLRQTARRHGIHVHGGSIGERSGDRLLNTSLLFGPSGRRLGIYRKIHLFDVITPGGEGYKESDTYRPGDEVVTVSLEGPLSSQRLGMAICYDLRFAELFRRLREEGADIVALPAAFTTETGAAHWEVLLRARAIEFQFWVAASGTTGRHRNAAGADRMTYGNSLVVDPWGTVVARAADGQGWASARIDPERSHQVRIGMPVMEHRRLS